MKEDKNIQSRRAFIRKSMLVPSLIPLMGRPLAPAETSRKLTKDASSLKVQVFSKHLQFLNYEDMADAAAEMGFDGVDLTVRPKGHVLPERVEDDLPKAIEAIRKANLSHTMITTAVQDADNTIDRKLLETASKLGVDFYRMNWLRYPENKSIPEAIEEFQQTIKALSALNRKLGIVGCYQNHSGNLAGASLWELWQILQKADKEHMGVQYDIRHAVVEGGMSWKNGLRLIQPDIKILAIKDFVWTKKENGYVVQNVPLGQGMVDFKSYFALLKEYNINVPVSLHYEYSLGGAEHGGTEITVERKTIFDTMKKDLQWLHATWNAA